MVPLNTSEINETKGKGYLKRNDLIIVTFLSLFSLVAYHFYNSSMRKIKVYCIPKYRQTLMTIRQQVAYTLLVLFSIMVDRFCYKLLTSFYGTLGVNRIFVAFWFNELWFFILIQVILPVLIYSKASRKLENFNGLRGKEYPGQEAPRPVKVVARREFGPDTNPMIFVTFHP